MPTAALKLELQQYLDGWEKINGPVDLTRYYTSRLPVADQNFLLLNAPERYFDGLPRFVQDFIRAKMDLAKAQGKADDMPSIYLRLYLTGKMQPSKRR